MKALPLRFLSEIVFFTVFCSFFSLISFGDDSNEDVGGASDSAITAAKAIEKRLVRLTERDFFDVKADRAKSYGRYPISSSMTYRNCLRNDLRLAFAELELAKINPTAKVDVDRILEVIVTGDYSDFFGCDGHINSANYQERRQLFEELVSDEELRFADRIFFLLKGSEDDSIATFAKWFLHLKELTSEKQLGTDGKLSVIQQARCVRFIHLFSFVLKSQSVGEVSSRSPESYEEMQKFLTGELAETIKRYCRRRFVEDGALRDRSLPIMAVANTIIPDLTLSVAGIAPYQEYKKLALAHARGLAALVEAIDAPMADTNLVRSSIGQIIDYRIKPFYLGSIDIREKGTLPCKPNGELEIILKNAKFFGTNGHLKGDVYRKRVEVLEQLFLRPSSGESRDFLFALKKPEEWLIYFENVLFSDSKESMSCFSAIRALKVSEMNMKNLFLARCILNHNAFEATTELRESRDALLKRVLDGAPQLAVSLFKEKPEQWNQVDLAFVEISKLVPEFDLTALSIPTFEAYLNQRRDYEWSIQSLPKDLASLAEPGSNNLLDYEIGLFQTDYIYRTGKFNKRLHPEFLKKINGKLDLIYSYRESQFTPPDLTARPSFNKAGSAIHELAVVNHHHPDNEPGNPQLHDLLEGSEGGFGGLGALFRCDPQGYESRETILDALTSSEDFELGDFLFKLAIDAGIEHHSDADKAASARRWLNYFKRTQSVVRFYTNSTQLTEAIRGAFLCRLIVQSRNFVEVVERSHEVAVGSPEDVSYLLENTLSSQIGIMNSILSSVVPSTALNKDIEQIKLRWYDLKAWHTESIKWIETILAEPTLMNEISRIRSLSRDKSDSYEKLAPAIGKIEQVIASVEPRIVAERNSDRREESFKPLDFANLVMGQLVTLQSVGESGSVVEEAHKELRSIGSVPEEVLHDEVTHQLLIDVRKAVAESGFTELSEVNSLSDFPSVSRAYYEKSINYIENDGAATHQLLLHQLKGAVAKARGRIEAERVTDLNRLEDLTIRAAKADRIFYAGNPDRYALLIDPSFLLHEWNNRHKIETIAEFRTVETRAHAQTQIFRYRKEREKLEQERKSLTEKRAELDSRLTLARKWAKENQYDFDPDSVIDQMLTMEDRVQSLQKEIQSYQKTEEKYRQHHITLAQQLHGYKMSDDRFSSGKSREFLLAQAKNNSSPDLEFDPSVTAIIKPIAKKTSSPRTTYRWSTSSSRNAASRSDSPSRGGFIQRFFRGN